MRNQKPVRLSLAFALALLLAACSGPAGPGEATVDLSLTFDAELPVAVQRAYLVVHHADGSPDRWFDLKELAGEEQPLPRIAEQGYMTVLTQTTSGGEVLRRALSLPTAIFVSLDKGFRIDEEGRIFLAFSGAENPWATFELSGACPDGADYVTNRSYGFAPGTDTLACSAGALVAGDLAALRQADGALSSYVWALTQDSTGAVGPTDPLAYARVFDVDPGAAATLAASDWAGEVEAWRLDVTGAPAGTLLQARFAAWRSDAEVLGFHAFSAACPDAGALCTVAAVPAERSGLDGFRLVAQLASGDATSERYTLAWAPIAPSGAYAWAYDDRFAPFPGEVAWSGSPPQVSVDTGGDADRVAAVVMSEGAGLYREWAFYAREVADRLDYPALTDELADFVPTTSGETVAVTYVGYGYDPLLGPEPPENGRSWAARRYLARRAVHGAAWKMDAPFVRPVYAGQATLGLR